MYFFDTTSKNIFSNDSTLNATLKSLDEILDSVGFAPWMSQVTTFGLSVINCLGAIGCSFSAWIFFRKQFSDSIFFYYRLLCLVNIVSLLHNIPACVLFSPRYFPSANLWAIAAFKGYYAFATIFFFHYGDVLQMGILLARMKIYSPFVKKHFNSIPPIVSLGFFLLCLIIDFPLAFAFKVISYGDYYYFSDLEQQQKVIATFFYYGASEFNEAKFGKVLLGFFGLVVNLLGSLVAGVALNIISYREYKQYVNERKRREKEIEMKTKAIITNNQPCTSNTIENNEDHQRQLKKLSQKELNELKAEKNMFHMIITLSIISIISRVILMFGNLYALVFLSLSTIWILVVLEYFIYALVPAVSIFIFYAFNKLFRKDFKRLFGFNKKNTTTKILIHSSSSNEEKRS